MQEATTIIQEFIYRKNRFVIVKYAGRFFVIDKRDIDENGKLTKEYHISYETIPEAITNTMNAADYAEMQEAGIPDALERMLPIITRRLANPAEAIKEATDAINYSMVSR